MKRNPRRVRWTKSFRRASGKEMTVDSTFEFEKRRNIPVRYDRDLMSKTLQTMQRVRAIRQRRERAFYVSRVEQGKVVERAGLARELAKETGPLKPFEEEMEHKNSIGSMLVEKRRMQSAKTRTKQRILASMSRNKATSASDAMCD